MFGYITLAMAVFATKSPMLLPCFSPQILVTKQHRSTMLDTYKCKDGQPHDSIADIKNRAKGL